MSDIRMKTMHNTLWSMHPKYHKLDTDIQRDICKMLVMEADKLIEKAEDKMSSNQPMMTYPFLDARRLNDYLEDDSRERRLMAIMILGDDVVAITPLVINDYINDGANNHMTLADFESTVICESGQDLEFGYTHYDSTMVKLMHTSLDGYKQSLVDLGYTKEHVNNILSLMIDHLSSPLGWNDGTIEEMEQGDDDDIMAVISKDSKIISIIRLVNRGDCLVDGVNTVESGGDYYEMLTAMVNLDGHIDVQYRPWDESVFVAYFPTLEKYEESLLSLGMSNSNVLSVMGMIDHPADILNPQDLFDTISDRITKAGGLSNLLFGN